LGGAKKLKRERITNTTPSHYTTKLTYQKKSIGEMRGKLSIKQKKPAVRKKASFFKTDRGVGWGENPLTQYIFRGQKETQTACRRGGEKDI